MPLIYLLAASWWADSDAVHGLARTAANNESQQIGKPLLGLANSMQAHVTLDHTAWVWGQACRMPMSFHLDTMRSM